MSQLKIIAILLIALGFAGGRIMGHTEDLFKTGAHCFDLFLLGQWWATRKLPPMQSAKEYDRISDQSLFYGWIGWGLALGIEVPCAAWGFFTRA